MVALAALAARRPEPPLPVALMAMETICQYRRVLVEAGPAQTM
jgi:hypothetical protein